MLNSKVFEWLHGLSGYNFLLDNLDILLAKYLPYFLGVWFLMIVFRESGRRRKIFLFLEGAMAVILARGLVTESIRFFYHHPRPFDAFGFAPLIAESGWSFPSGHAAFFFALAVTVFYMNRKLGMWFFALSFLVGIARIFAGVHWPADILGGIVVGLVSGYIVHALLAPYARELRKEKAPDALIGTGET